VEEIVAALAEQQAEMDGLLADLDDRGWARPSACEGWSVADVVLHLAQTNEMAVGSARDDYQGAFARLVEGVPPTDGDVDDGAALMVAAQRGGPPGELRQRWERSCADLRAALLTRAPSDRVTWVMGDMAARTLATTRLAETWIHTGDVADGLGATLEPGDRLRHVAHLAWRTIPYAFDRAGEPPPGAVAFELVAPSGGQWSFGESAPTVIRGPGYDLCRVASRRVDPSATALTFSGPDGESVLRLIRTWA
jgi:uncharacterized protein (TIGR03084 family)